MPKKSIRTGTAQAARSGIEKRTKRQPAPCRGRKGSENSGTIFADSIFTVTFQPKSGTEILFIHGAHEFRQSILVGDGFTLDTQQLYADLWNCYRRAHKLIEPGKPIINPLTKLKFTYSRSLDYIFERFRHLIPQNWLFNVDKEPKGGYYFTIYSDVPSDPEISAFFIAGAVKKLYRNNVKLHRLFLEFLKCFMYELDIEPWWRLMDYSFESMENEMYDNHKLEEDYKKGLQRELRLYKEGKAYWYQEVIRTAMPIDTAEILSRVKHFRKNPIVELIIAGCELIQQRFKWSDFAYVELNADEYSDVYLRLFYQCCVGWTYEGAAWEWHEEYINADANEGIQRPIANFKITPRTKSIDFNRLEQMRQFPDVLYSFFNNANRLLNEYERPNRKAGK